MSRYSAIFPFLGWSRLTPTLLRGELLAGLTVGLMMIPQSVAYAVLAGMPPEAGIYAAILPPIVAVLFSSSTRLSSGPAALSCLLIGTGIAGLGLDIAPGSPQWVQLAIWLALLSGLMQALLGFMRFGWLLNVISAPVLTAFTQAAALLIIASQLSDLLGVHDWRALVGRGAFEAPHGPALAFGLGTLALLLLARRWKPAFPWVLLIMLAAAGLSRLMGFEAAGGAVIGELASSLPPLVLPDWPGLSVFGALLLPALVITFVSFMEVAASAKVDHEGRATRWNQDQDLISQGFGKIAAGFSGAFPISASFSRSALNLYAGAKSGWATVFASVVVLLAFWLIAPVLRHVPQAVLAAIVVAAVSNLLKPREFVRLWRVARVECIVAGITFALTLAVSPLLHWGVIAGVLMSLSYFLYQRLHPRIIEVGLHPDGSLRDRHLWQLPPLATQTYALRMDAALDFASAAEFERTITEHLAARAHGGDAVRRVCLFAQPINHVDATGVDAFLKVAKQLREHGVEFHIIGMKLPVERSLLAAGWKTGEPGQHLHRTDAEALAALKQA